MTPIQTLVRVQDIQRQVANMERSGEVDQVRLAELHDEFNRLLTSAVRPPVELIGQIDPAVWASAFCEHCADHAPETMLPWFDAAMASAHGLGRTQGHAEGSKSGAQAVQQLIEVAQLVLLLHDSKRHRLTLVRDNNNPDAPPENVSEQLRRALLALGIEPLTPQ